jgi:hypothetical protein
MAGSSGEPCLGAVWISDGWTLRLTADQRRALRLLAGTPLGVTEAMMAHGFRPAMLARLALKGLATVTTGTMQAGAATMKVERYKITDDGRKALG